jgi:hypothetical protein
MSVDCAVMFNDPERTVITMTVWDWSPEGYDLARVLNLAVAAYESRMKRPAPLIEGSGSKYLDGIVDILGIQDRNILTGKTGSVLQQGEYRRTMMWLRALLGFRKRDGDGDARPEPRRQRPRSPAEWEELKRGRDLRRLARADPALRRELLNTMDTCPCCGRWLKREEDQRGEGAEREAMQFARGRHLLPAE